jgi:hypothetical protein
MVAVIVPLRWGCWSTYASCDDSNSASPQLANLIAHIGLNRGREAIGEVRNGNHNESWEILTRTMKQLPNVIEEESLPNPNLCRCDGAAPPTSQPW